MILLNAVESIYRYMLLLFFYGLTFLIYGIPLWVCINKTLRTHKTKKNFILFLCTCFVLSSVDCLFLRGLQYESFLINTAIFIIGSGSIIAGAIYIANIATRHKTILPEIVLPFLLLFPWHFILFFIVRICLGLLTGSQTDNHFLATPALSQIPGVSVIGGISTIVSWFILGWRFALFTLLLFIIFCASLYVADYYNLALTYDDWVSRGMPAPF